MMRNLQHWDDLAAEARGPTVMKRSLPGVAVTLVRLEIKAGTQAARHAHPFEQFVQVLAGRGMLETADGTAPFTAGAIFHFPAGAWHAATFDDDTTLVETNLHTE